MSVFNQGKPELMIEAQWNKFFGQHNKHFGTSELCLFCSWKLEKSSQKVRLDFWYMVPRHLTICRSDQIYSQFCIHVLRVWYIHWMSGVRELFVTTNQLGWIGFFFSATATSDLTFSVTSVLYNIHPSFVQLSLTFNTCFKNPSCLK